MHHSIEVYNLSYAYPDGHQALNDVSLHIEPCEKVALVGPNGAGKSTLILHLNGILAGQGDICVAGLPVIRISETAMNKRIIALLKDARAGRSINYQAAVHERK